MKLVARDTDYAVRVLLCMARHRKGMSATQLNQELKIPKAFLRRILQRLGKAGVLTSRKGVGGGFSLALSPGKIRLADLVVLFQGNVRFVECVFKQKICPDQRRCPLRETLKRIESEIVHRLMNVTIAKLLKQGGNS